MINIVLAMSLALFSFEMFSLTAKISGLNKTMLNIPMSIFTYSVPLLSADDFYFTKSVLEEKCNAYFATNITKLVNDYTLKYTYYDASSGGICMSTKCSQVKVSLTTTIDGIYSYHRAMEYLIGEGNG